jgi:hypothetical protein
MQIYLLDKQLFISIACSDWRRCFHSEEMFVAHVNFSGHKTLHDSGQLIHFGMGAGDRLAGSIDCLHFKFASIRQLGTRDYQAIAKNVRINRG